MISRADIKSSSLYREARIPLARSSRLAQEEVIGETEEEELFKEFETL